MTASHVLSHLSYSPLSGIATRYFFLCQYLIVKLTFDIKVMVIIIT
jgi:hypothetical protein